MVVGDLSNRKQTDTLPDTVTSIVFKGIDFFNLKGSNLSFADRVVEIR